MPFIVDDPTSWPPEAVAALREALPILRGYRDHRRRIDREREENPDDLMMRVNPPRNPHYAAREDLIAEVGAHIAGLSVTAWHCNPPVRRRDRGLGQFGLPHDRGRW